MDNRRIVVTGYLLTVIAGWVDAQGFLALQGVFVSFMTGNTTLLGLALAPGNWTKAGPIALVIGLFVAGGACGAFLSGLAGRWWMPAVLTVEVAILLIALGLSAGDSSIGTGAVLLAAAMGVQNAASTTVGPVRAGVTYVTGSLVSVSQELGKLARGSGSAGLLVKHVSSWIALLAGVAAGATAHAQFGLLALVAPCAAVAALAAQAGISIARS